MAVRPPGSVIAGRYEIDRELARGAMGVVYLARHTLSRKEVALKLLDARVSSNETSMARFHREVSVRAETKHEGIVDVLDAGIEPDGSPFIAMELLEGESLRARFERSTDRREKLGFVVAMLDPLAAAHAKGFVHRDLKPDNVFVARRADGTEHVKILDFGIARQSSAMTSTQTSTTLGTPHYMSPEQAMSAKSATPAADVWSVGVMLYEVLAGERPFEGETPHAVILAAVAHPHRALRERAPQTSPQLAELVDRCLAKSPESRPPDAAVLRRDLVAALETCAAASTSGPPLGTVETVFGQPIPMLVPPSGESTAGGSASRAEPAPTAGPTEAMPIVSMPIGAGAFRPPARSTEAMPVFGGDPAHTRAAGAMPAYGSDPARARSSSGTFDSAPRLGAGTASGLGAPAATRPDEPKEKATAPWWFAPLAAAGLVIGGVAIAAIAGIGPFERAAAEAEPPAPLPVPMPVVAAGSPESVGVRHVIVAFSGGRSDVTRTRDEARARADVVLARARRGDDFPALAREMSDDRTAAARGGDLGRIRRGSMVAPFEAAAFALQPGQISDVVETTFGFHVIQRYE